MLDLGHGLVEAPHLSGINWDFDRLSDLVKGTELDLEFSF